MLYCNVPLAQIVFEVLYEAERVLAFYNCLNNAVMFVCVVC